MSLKVFLEPMPRPRVSMEPARRKPVMPERPAGATAALAVARHLTRPAFARTTGLTPTREVAANISTVRRPEVARRWPYDWI